MAHAARARLAFLPASGATTRRRPGLWAGASPHSKERAVPDSIRVLIVDDEEDFATALVQRLRRRGFVADSVFTGEAALERLSKDPYDVAVGDLKMPGMDGLATLRALKRAGLKTSVVVLTGHATVASGIEGMQIGAADFLQKPVDLAVLCTAIRAASERAREET